MQKILFVDDEKQFLAGLEYYFSTKGYDVSTASSGEGALRRLETEHFDLLVTDMAMRVTDGMQVLESAKLHDPDMPVIIMTGVGTVENAVRAMHKGAFDYVTKPIGAKDLLTLVQKALARRSDSFQEKQGGGHLVIGSNPAIQQVLHTIQKVSGSDATVLIQGETGTGKSMFARRVHELSDRKDGSFLTIDCGALAENLLESELFGHVRGAFTGAVNAKKGLLEEAEGGTVFLDEIGELSSHTQVKLLRAIQEREIKPVGGITAITIDVRFVSATSRNLVEEVEQGRFRKDLYYRLAVIPLTLPPLRERWEDIPLFVDHFMRAANARYGCSVTRVPTEVLQAVQNAFWEGNIRELENFIERAVLLADGELLAAGGLSVVEGSRASAVEPTAPVSLRQAVRDAEKRAIQLALAVADGNRTRAASILGIGRRTLYDKMGVYGLDVEREW